MLRQQLIYCLLLGLSFAVTHHAVAQTRQGDLASRVARLERTVDSTGLVDLLQQVESLQHEVQKLTGIIENQTYAIEQLRKTQRDTYVDLDQRIRSGDASSALAGVPQLPAGAPMATEPPLSTLNTAGEGIIAGTPAPRSALQVQTQGVAPLVTATVRTPDRTAMTPQTGAPVGLPMPSTDGGLAAVDPSMTPTTVAPAAIETVPAPSIMLRGPTIDNQASETAYRDAFSLLKAGQYEESITAFNAFLVEYPRSQYADNAQYWLGETFFILRQFEQAIAEYQKLIAKFPASKKLSHAWLKIGYCYHELGQADQARAALEDLRRRYPGTTAARLAEERLQRLHAEAVP